MIKIMFDVMGTDKGIKPALLAACRFLNENSNLFITFAGDAQAIKKVLKSLMINAAQYDVLNCKDVITMEDGILAVRRKPQASMAVALKTFQQDQAYAFILSGGSTASYVAGVQFVLKKISAVNKLAYAVFIPTIIERKVFLMLDVGANLNASAEDIAQIALLGGEVYKTMFPVPHPRIGLVNIGTEPKKGTAMHQKAYQLMKAHQAINFQGNVEPKALLAGMIDVAVCDGYTGNLVLKAMEGTFKHLTQVIKKQITANLKRKLAALCLRKAFRDVKNVFNYKNYAGALILGAQRLAIKTHGSADEQSFYAALNIGYQWHQSHLIKNINQLLAKTTHDSPSKQ